MERRGKRAGVVEGVASTVRVKVCAGSLRGVGALDVLVCGQITGGQVRVESCQADDGPDTEETDDTDYDACRRVSNSIKEVGLQLNKNL